MADRLVLEMMGEDMKMFDVEQVKALNDLERMVYEYVVKDPEKVKEILTDSKTIVDEDDDIDVSKLELLTQVQDLSIVDLATGKIVKDAKDVTVTWEVTNLKKDLGEVRVLHYSTVRDVWEILKPEKVDYKEKAVTQHFEDLSPVAVVYVPADEK